MPQNFFLKEKVDFVGGKTNNKKLLLCIFTKTRFSPTSHYMMPIEVIPFERSH